MPDSAFQLAGRQLFRADRNRLSRKARGGGLCVYINKEDGLIQVSKTQVNPFSFLLVLKGKDDQATGKYQ
ncbi:hypothetical protein SRHO_G00126690 [Serrasalmus rhombeus]